MRLGLSTPVVTKVPGLSAPWEDEAGTDEIVEVACAADRLGFGFLTCSEHIGVPPGGWSPRLPQGRGTRYWDPLATLSWIGGRTEQIRLVPSVLVLSYQHPLAIAKRYGTLDRLSSGRVVLGLGVGTIREEFEVLGAPFEDRGSRADDAVRALRACLSRTEPVYHGLYYDIEGLVVDPCAVQKQVPLWIGGHSERALRRAVTLGDGWMPGAPAPDELRSMLARFPDRADAFEVVVGAGESLDAIEDPQRCEDLVGAVADAGATMVVARPRADSLEHCREQLEAIAGLDCFEPAPKVGPSTGGGRWSETAGTPGTGDAATAEASRFCG